MRKCPWSLIDIVVLLAASLASRPGNAGEPLDIGSRLEPLVDDYLIDLVSARALGFGL